MVGKVLGHYRILEKVGGGGMGVVYKAHDEHLNRDVALKVLPTGKLANEAARKRFRKEVLALSKLNHPNIATVHDFGTDDGVDFLVMEYISGTTLANRLKGGPLTEKEVVKLGTQVAAALEEAHEQGVTHRDLKPENIMVTPKGQAKVMDFGLANVLEPASDLASTASCSEAWGTAGTLPYMSPEQLRGDFVDARSDIWAAGAVLYEAATGQRPFPEAGGARLIDAILNRAPQPPSELNPRISPALESIILKALDKDPALRYQAARELLIDQERLTAGVVAAGLRREKAGRGNRLFLAAALAVFVFAGWLGFRAWRSPSPSSQRASVLIGAFENRTGESIFDLSLSELLKTSLEQSRYVNVFPDSRVPDVLRRMERASNVRIDETVGREICEREGLQAVLLGSISRMGNLYVLIVRATNPAGRVLVSAQRAVAEAGQVPQAVDALAGQLRTGLGESLPSIHENSAPLAQVTSASLEAIRYFTLGKQRLHAGDAPEAIAFFQKALELDSAFAMAHEYLGVAYTNLNDPARAEIHLRDASRLVNRVTEIEKLKILGDYSYVIGNYEEAYRYYKVLSELQPLDPAHLSNLGLCDAGRFDFDSAIAETEKALQLQPIVPARNNLARYYRLEGNTAKSIAIAQEILHDHPTDVEALTTLGMGYLLSGQLPQARRTFEAMLRAGGDPESEGQAALADLSLATGRYREARSHLEAAIIAAEKRGNRFAAARDTIALAELSVAKGSSPQVARLLSRIHAPTENPILAFLLARAYARGSKLTEARKMLQWMDSYVEKRQTPRLESLRLLLRAEVALAQGGVTEAVEAAQTAVHYENSTLAGETLARSNMAAGKNEEAIREYERVLARGSERAASYDAPAFHRVVEIHYRLAILYENSGQADRARTHLETFLNYWSQPDTDLEIYKDARRRLRSAALGSAPARGTPTPAT